MNPYWSNIVRQLAPYVPGEQPKVGNLVKLNTNENPFGPSPAVLAAIREELSDKLRLYPDPNASALKGAIASEYGLTNAHVFAGNGSDEVLAHTFLGLLKHDAPLLFADVTYSFYPVYCGLYDIAHELVPLDSDYCLNVSDYFERAAGAIIIANPNAPTGRALTRDQVEQLVKRRSDVVVAVDEAYIDFGGETAATLIARYPNLLVIHTLSKSRSLAGLRVGYALGHPELIEALERVKNCFNSYPLDRLAIAGAMAAMKDRAYFDSTRAQVMATRERLTLELGQLGFEVLPSKANFVFARHPNHDASELMRLLRERSIIVRHFKLPRIDQFLRISIGTAQECTLLVAALSDILRSPEDTP